MIKIRIDYDEKNIFDIFILLLISLLTSKIAKMQYYPTDWHHGRSPGAENPPGFVIAYIAVVTFSEEYYEDTTFFYKTARLEGRGETGEVFVTPLLESPYYILKDGVEEFKGIGMAYQHWDKYQ